jgi:molybdopterin-biosynthesis enzyme MoeA-like protein
MPYDDITREAYDRVMQLDLPEDREPTREVQKKLDSIEHYLSEKEKEQAEANKAAAQQANKQAEQPKAEVKFYRNK